MHHHEQPSITPPPADEMSMFEYLEIIAKKWRLIAKVTVAAAILSILVALSLPKIFSSTARILPPQQDINLMGMMMGGTASGLSNLAGGMLGLGTPADQYASILRTERISDAIIDRFKLMEVYKKDYRLDMYEKLDGLVDIKAGKKDGIISITVEDEDPKRAAEIANAYVSELGELTSEINMTGGGKNKAFLEKRLAQSRADLSKAEDEIKKFQFKNKAIDVSEQAKVSLAGIAELRAQLALQEVQLASMNTRFTANNQEVKDAKAAIAKIKAKIAQLEGNGKGGAIPTVGSMPAMGQEYVRLMREFKIQETVVELLTKQYELAKLNEAKDVDTIQVIQEARPADKKIKPRRARIVLATTFISMVSAVLFVVMQDYMIKMPEIEKNKYVKMLSTFKNCQS